METTTEEFDMHTLARHEIIRWYEVFYGWSRGLVSQNEVIARQIWDSLTPDFRVVLTNGRVMDKGEYWRRLVDLYGARAGSPRSEIENLSLQSISHRHVLATFDLVKPGVASKKFDTAILQKTPDQPLGIMWSYVHESAHDL